jgi:hypothetical protein
MTEKPESREARSAKNVLAWCFELGYDLRPLGASQVLEAFPDKCYVEWSLGLSDLFHAKLDLWTLGINLPDHQPWGVPSAVWGGRERRARWAGQVVEHQHPTTSQRLFELDFDPSNPNWCLALTLAHLMFDVVAQKIRKTKTNPFTVAKKRGWLTSPGANPGANPGAKENQ